MMILAPEKTTIAGGRILIVDDDDGVRENLAELFQVVGYSVVTAGSAPEAMGKLAHHDVDLLLTDYRMPGPNGVELIDSARGLLPPDQGARGTGPRLLRARVAFPQRKGSPAVSFPLEVGSDHPGGRQPSGPGRSRPARRVGRPARRSQGANPEPPRRPAARVRLCTNRRIRGYGRHDDVRR